MEQADFYRSIYPQKDSICIWRGPQGWSVFVPQNVPREVAALVREFVERLEHQAP